MKTEREKVKFLENYVIKINTGVIAFQKSFSKLVKSFSAAASSLFCEIKPVL